MKKLTSTIVLAALACAAPVTAQNVTPQTAPKPINMADLRHHIYVMEGALARAVDFGAKQLNREIAQVAPSVFMLEGAASARGLHLDGYGVFFDVRIPTMRQSMVWSLRMLLEQDATTQQAAISELKKSMQGITDAATRARMENAVRQLERANPANDQLRSGDQQNVTPGLVTPASESIPIGAATASGVISVRPAPAAPAAAVRDSLWAKDPDRAYTEAVTRALVDAMIDYSAPMQIGSDQWLTVAARDDEGRDTLAPPDPMEEVMTLIFRIKGSDLQEYRQGRIDRDEVRRRVQLSQF